MTALLAHAPGVALRCHEALYLVYSMVWVLAVQIKSIKLIHGSVFLAGWGVGYISCVVASPKALLSGRNRQPSLGMWPSAWTSEFMNAFSRKNIQIQYRPEKKMLMWSPGRWHWRETRVWVIPSTPSVNSTFTLLSQDHSPSILDEQEGATTVAFKAYDC